MKFQFTLVSILSTLVAANGYSIMGAPTRRSTMTMRRGKPGTQKKIPKQGGFGDASDSPPAQGSPSQKWMPIPYSAADLGKAKEGKVELYDTEVETLVDSLTNPTGAVSVLKHDGETYCFSSSCPSCKIPLSGAKVLPATSSRPTPLVACSFCKSAYDLKTGTKTEVSPEEAGGGLFAGLAKSMFKATGNTDPLPRYQLGEKDGKLLINIK